MFTKAFVKDVVERAVKAFGSASASVFAAGEVANLFAVNWADVFGVGGGAAVVSVLLSLASYKAGHSGTASAVKEVVYNGTSRVL
ncbi:holin [Streptomyces phage Wakanda]|uniref:Holin n=1 Tax=Streptomyces phage Wakanda TaxID=2713267 RepID=A0A6G8R1G2_9CAUD|nr:holin [Streptomyces phage Wakanda]QIN94040.1 holin [Streptomyces phage Wakanda]